MKHCPPKDIIIQEIPGNKGWQGVDAREEMRIAVSPHTVRRASSETWRPHIKRRGTVPGKGKYLALRQHYAQSHPTSSSNGYKGLSRLGGVVVSVLATGPKGRGFEPGQDDGFLRAIIIRSTPSFGWEVKPEVPCRKILRHAKDLLKSHGDEHTKFSFPQPILLLAPEMSLLTGPPDSTGGCQSVLVDMLGVSPSRYHHTVVHITITRGWIISL
jgi:hypothetical protein